MPFNLGQPFEHRRFWIEPANIDTRMAMQGALIGAINVLRIPEQIYYAPDSDILDSLGEVLGRIPEESPLVLINRGNIMIPQVTANYPGLLGVIGKMRWPIDGVESTDVVALSLDVESNAKILTPDLASIEAEVEYESGSVVKFNREILVFTTHQLVNGLTILK